MKQLKKIIEQYNQTFYYASWLHGSVRRPDDDPIGVETCSQLA